MTKRPKSSLTWNSLCKLDINPTKQRKLKARNISKIDWSKLSKTDPQWLCHPVALRAEQFVTDIVKKSEFSDMMIVNALARSRNNKPNDHYDEKHVDAWVQVNIFIPRYGGPFGENVCLSTDYLRTRSSLEGIDWDAIEKRVSEIFDYYKKHRKNIIAFFRSTAKLVDEIRKQVPLYGFNTKPLLEDGCIEVGFGDSPHSFVFFHREDNTVSWAYRDSNGSLQWKRVPIGEATAEEILNNAT
ncbi:MAG: hypothetical protein LBH25_01005 [Fibromonadaceae bacterium]|jgi:hypothetical protein|nr:hypothetical protein [Fibromonadaceae bacterium]